MVLAAISLVVVRNRYGVAGQLGVFPSLLVALAMVGLAGQIAGRLFLRLEPADIDEEERRSGPL